MKLALICVGEPRGPVASAVREYEERIARYWRFETVAVDGGEGKTKKTDPGRVLEAESQRLLARLPEGGEVIALTRNGKAWGSRELARYLEEQAVRAVPRVTFLIGGAYGLGPSVLKRATQKVSLSKMTLPHELARLLLVEQIYRSGTILKNEPYHKGP